MPGSLLVARVFGIDIRIHISWFLIFGLVLISYSDPNGGLLSQVRPFWSDQKLVVVAAIYALLFFVSILAHEMSHALVARAFKMPVSSITLFLLGGVANLAKEPPSARVEFLMAIAGPAMSCLIGGIAIGISQFSDQLIGTFPALDPVGVVAFYLGLTNLLVAGFNMIPGFPLDGGRVLRSIVWGIAKDRSRATRFAARGGQLVAVLLFLFGVGRAFSEGETFSALWLAMIAYFLYNAAGQSIEQEKIASAVADVNVAQLMTTEFRAVDPRTTVAELVSVHLLPHNSRSVAVVEGQDLRGIVSIADLRKVDQQDWPTTLVDRVMTPAAQVPSVAPSTRLMVAIERFAAADLPALPVIQGGVIVGMLDRDSVASYVRMREMLGLDQKR